MYTKPIAYIPILEFIEQGGKILDGMSLYTNEGICLGWFEKSVQTLDPHNIILSQSNRTFAFPHEMVRVKVQCQPIYIAV
jgi:hypothetical protein